MSEKRRNSTAGGEPSSKRSTMSNEEKKEMRNFQELIEGNNLFVEERMDTDPEYFKQLATGQQPRYLYIGCSDSRAPIEMICKQDPGNMFVHRNIANMVVGTDLNLLSVLEYSVAHLGVKHIIVCGHYGCGGVAAAMKPGSLGLLDHWLRNIRDVARLHADELDQLDEAARYKRLIELNVQEQCINVYKTSVVQESIRKRRLPLIHGCVFDLATGLFTKLDIDFKDEFSDMKHVYSLSEPSTLP